MIHKVDDVYCISSNQVWLPGAYATERAAKYAFRFTDEQLSNLQNSIAPNPITFEMLQNLRKNKLEIETPPPLR